jgi:hypothetical protein
VQRSSIVTTVTAGFIGGALLASAGCGGSKPGTNETPAAQASPAPQNPAQAAQQMAQSLQQMGQGQAVPAVDFEKLVALVPELSGWTRTEPKGSQVSVGISVSKAEAEYSKGDANIRLEITDTSLSQMILAPLSMMLVTNYSERSSNGYKKYAALGGNPGFETWENDSKNGEVTVVVANRFLVQARGSNVDKIDVVRSLVQAVDLGKLAALK